MVSNTKAFASPPAVAVISQYILMIFYLQPWLTSLGVTKPSSGHTPSWHSWITVALVPFST